MSDILKFEKLNKIGSLIKKKFNSPKICIITDDIIYKKYFSKLYNSLNYYNFEIFSFVFTHGEENKNIHTVQKMYECFLEHNLTRSDLIIALGGGVVGDTTSFAASTFLRGINFVNIPTTFLAQVDSCLGGKTGINLKRGKNLVGTFYHPKMIIIDTDFLNTLSKKLISDGYSEVIKYGAIRDKKIFNDLKNESKDYLIKKCLNIKKSLVKEDEKDLGERMLLNFGHTIGHAIEKIYNYKDISHGQAVAIGMYMITKASEKNNLTKLGCSEKIKKILINFSLPYKTDLSMEEISKVIVFDKKNLNNKLNLILIKDIGKGFVYEIPSNEFLKFMKGEYKSENNSTTI